MKLPLGNVYASMGAIAAFAAALDEDPDSYLSLHSRANDASKHDERVLSAYTLRTGEEIWIVTEADRSSTTILLPSEY
jgi:hypothetical protein